ncbi:hypothetical protein PCCS19_10860 [Paenibacillus sp. CCS19]|uniref:glycoside hydrolase family 113 n=1 Tax=Paenibacillus sp. CCS19 TaxID=3158387 RepID=UPI00255E6B16|nr:1,4-beta-xylanase [Paenibacillus cellulosilyticus]GMK38032.1 hypothetical protein PCCS19_10860 [Paenibacillus cellulosilyticus]
MTNWNEQTYIAGMTWGWTGIRGTWTTKEADRSMALMKERLAINWTAVTFAALQATPQSTTIPFAEAPTVTEEEVRHAIAEAKRNGLNVCLKPVVNCVDGTWRAHINFFDYDVPCEPKWSDWFASYTSFILHYARVAEETGCEMLCIGCEMVQTDRREAEWRQLIREVRNVYSGIVTYNCDKYQEDRVQWWDAVDVISSSGYYPVGDWEVQLDRVEKVVQRFNKPFFFMEAGCPSRRGSELLPNDWGFQGETDGTAQLEFYEAMFGSSDQRPWVQGFMLWDWPSTLYPEEQAASNNDYCMFGKPAEAYIRNYYSSKLAQPNYSSSN